MRRPQLPWLPFIGFLAAWFCLNAFAFVPAILPPPDIASETLPATLEVMKAVRDPAAGRGLERKIESLLQADLLISRSV